MICSAGSEVQQLRPKHMAVLQELAHQAPSVVSRSTLIDRVWPRGFVNPNVLNNAVSRLRKQLDDSGASLIETIPRHGYRLTVPVTLTTVTSPLIWGDGSPYRGLASYEADHASVFFGRSREVSEIISAFEHQATEGQGFVMLLGASGVGKTSLINAGVVPALIAAEAPVLKANWKVVPVRVGPNISPWKALATAVTEALGGPGAIPFDAAEFEQTLERDFPGALQTAINTLDRLNNEGKARILLVLDHLELLLSDPETTANNEPVFAAIHEMVRTGRIWVIAGLRSDFYQECGRSHALSVLRRDRGQFDVSTPNAEQIGMIIREPASAAGLAFETDSETGIALNDHMQAGAIGRPDVLPLLQFCLDALYERKDDRNRLTYSALAEAGGLDGSMARRAEQLFDSLDDAARSELPIVLSAMVRLTSAHNRRYSRRFAITKDLVTTPARERLINVFVAGRLFVTDLLNNQPVVSVVHESLFRHWARARKILEENRELLAFSQRLSDASSTWEDNARSDHYLLGAGPLNESEKLLSSGAVPLPPREIDLIDASRQRAQRTTVVRRIAVGALVALAVTALTAATLATVQRREAITEATRASQTTAFLVQLFQLANPGQSGGNDLTAKQVLDLGAYQLSSQLNQQPAVRTALLQTIGSVYMNLGLYEEARPLLTEALQTRQSSGAPKIRVSESLNSLGKLSYFGGDYNVASQKYHEAQTLLASNGDLNSAAYADTLNNLGEVASALGDYKLAIEHHQSALTIRQKLFGSNSSESGTSVQNLAGALRKNGGIEEAERLYRQAIDIQETAYGPAHPEVAVALSNLGLLLTDAERYDAAEPLLGRALDIRRRVFGDNHLHTANSLHNLSAMLFRKGDYANAEPIFNESLALHIKLFGDGHDSVAYGRNNLATLLLDTGRTKQAQHQFELAFESLSASLGTEHPNTALIRGNLAKASLAAGNYRLAEKHAGAAVAVLSAALPPEHWRLAAVKTIYGSALSAGGNFEQAEQVLLESWKALSNSHGPKSEMSQRVVTALVGLYSQNGNSDKRQAYEALKTPAGSITDK